ncbi:Galactokinase [Streptomyces tendae]
MTGGGFGGSAIVLVEAADVDTVTKAVEDAFAHGAQDPAGVRGGALGGGAAPDV